jgi:hypothetical protein
MQFLINLILKYENKKKSIRKKDKEKNLSKFRLTCQTRDSSYEIEMTL